MSMYSMGSLVDRVLKFSNAEFDNIAKHPANLLDRFHDLFKLVLQEVSLHDELLEVNDLAFALNVLLRFSLTESLGTVRIVFGVLCLDFVKVRFQKLHERPGLLRQSSISYLVLRDCARNHLKLLPSKLEDGLSSEHFLLPTIKVARTLGLKLGERFTEGEDIEWCAHYLIVRKPAAGTSQQRVLSIMA